MIKFDVSIVSKPQPTIDWKKFDPLLFEGLPEVLIGEIIEDLCPTGIVARQMMYAVERTDAHACYHLGASLAMLAACVPQHMTLAEDNTKANMFILLLGPSREAHKSHAVEIGPLDLLKGIAGVGGTSAPRMLPEQGSIQKLIDEVISNPQVLIWKQEFGSMLADSAGGSGYMAGLRDRLTDLADAFPVQRATVAKRGINPIQEHPRLSLIAACTAEHLAQYTRGFDWLSGFLQRFLLLYATPERSWDMARIGDSEKAESIRADLRRMADIRVTTKPRFSQEAKDFWKTWQQSLKLLNSEDRKDPYLTPALKAAEVQAKKMAMLFAFDRLFAMGGDIPQEWEIDGLDMRAALKIANLHIMSSRRLTSRLADTLDGMMLNKLLSLLDEVEPRPQSLLVRQMEMRISNFQQLIATLAGRKEVQMCGALHDDPMYIKVRPEPHKPMKLDDLPKGNRDFDLSEEP